MALPAKRRKLDDRIALSKAIQAAEPSTELDADSQSSSEDEQFANGVKASYNTLLKSLGRSVKVPRLSSNGASKNSKISSQKSDAVSARTLDEGVSGVTETEKDDEHPEQPSDELEPDEIDSSDPFEIHFANPDENELSARLRSIAGKVWSKETLRVQNGDIATSFVPKNSSSNPKTDIENVRSVKNLKLKMRLQPAAERVIPSMNGVQAALARPMFEYKDLLYGGRTPDNAADLRDLTCLHILNHVLKTRDRVIKNNNRVARLQTAADLDLRDQGFTRPKILILLETRQTCVRYMDAITRLCDPDQQENRKRFQDAFMQPEDNFTDEKPADFCELFDGNDDNEFRLGVKFTRKTIKYYSQFYNSDIIFASPLGLRQAIKADDPKKADHDFLSSIEVVVVDQADAMLQQNWDHVEHAFSYLNLQPKDAHGCDFSRVRQYYLDNQSRYLRQTIILSAYITPELNGIFSTNMSNVAGKMRIQPIYKGAIQSIGMPIRQTFNRFDSKSPTSEPDERFAFFSRTIIPSLAKLPPAAPGEGHGILIFIPSYFDFVRLRNYFAADKATSSIEFGQISEYHTVSEVRRTRSHFLSGKHSVLLYSGRAHHFRRYRIRGVKRVIVYGLPENPLFYTELVGGFLGESIDSGLTDASQASVKALFSKWDSLALERIVGTHRVGRMLKDVGGDTFDFR